MHFTGCRIVLPTAICIAASVCLGEDAAANGAIDACRLSALDFDVDDEDGCAALSLLQRHALPTTGSHASSESMAFQGTPGRKLGRLPSQQGEIQPASPKERATALRAHETGRDPPANPRARIHRFSGLSLAEMSHGRSSVGHRGAAHLPNPAGWFGDFSQAESTYTTEGFDASKESPEWAVKYGADPSVMSPFANSQALSSAWFHESQSAGPVAAWQTHFPAVSAGVAGNRGTGENPWRQTPSGWVQDYWSVTSQPGLMRPDPVWFDSSIHQVDGFGRQLTPGANDGQYYIDGWEARSVNTTIKCKSPGCSAASSLQLWNPMTEEARLCRLSIDVHATDYDEGKHGEHVEFWKVNGYVASQGCSPGVRGCNASTGAPLYACVSDMNVDRIVNDRGTLVIQGKNSKLVDECPYDGDLLSAVAMATCMVRPKPAPPPPPNRATLLTETGEAFLKCREPGCTAETDIKISPRLALHGGKCVMDVVAHQTDFDDTAGALEQIDFIAVGNRNLTAAPLKPGRNPCIEKSRGQKFRDMDDLFLAVRNYDVTRLLQSSDGSLRVRGKISEQVDDCPFEGNLLHAKVSVTCKSEA